jgi:hypothetical protein
MWIIAPNEAYESKLWNDSVIVCALFIFMLQN